MLLSSARILARDAGARVRRVLKTPRAALASPRASDDAWAAFVPVATAHVTADGASIRTDDRQTVPELTWLGVRAR